MRTENTNFALLVSHKFTEPFSAEAEFAKERFVVMPNELSNGSIIIQTLRAFVEGAQKHGATIRGNNFIEPSMKEGRAWRFGLVLPYKTMVALREND